MKMKTKRVPVSKLYPSQLKAEWKKLGRRAMRLWKATGGVDPEIDQLFKRMDAIDNAISRRPRSRRIAQR
jgi:hypothetical protein